MKLDAGIVDDLKRQKPNIAILTLLQYSLTSPPAPLLVGEGSKTPVPPSLAGKGARGLGVGVPHLIENCYNNSQLLNHAFTKPSRCCKFARHTSVHEFFQSRHASCRRCPDSD